MPTGFSVFDLTFHFGRSDAGIRLNLEYNTELFSKARMERLASHLDRVIEAIVTSPDTTLADIDILSEEERQRILVEFSKGPAMAAPTQTVIDMFVAEALRNADRTAVVFEQRNLSYGDLSAASARLAERLRRVGIVPGSVVALLAERSEWIVVGVIGIMASGAACLPIDADQPRERMSRMLQDSGCTAIVSDCMVSDGLAADYLPIIALRDSSEHAGGPLVGSAQLSDVAYVTYTSGSTGTPKGSLIEHRSLANLVTALGPCLYDGLPQPATELLLTSIGFDVAMKQVFGALTRGNTLVVAGDDLRRDPAALMSAVARCGIHLLDLTPAHFSLLLAQGFARTPKPSLRAIVLGSESLPCALVKEFTKNESNRPIALYNFYGPSECTVEGLYCRLDGMPLSGTRIAPVGRPIANARVYVLSSDGKPVPIGIPGEICLGGLPVGRGYLKRPELTASRFVKDPLHPDERIYRTGDIGRRTNGGILEFLGRSDGQLKIRGYRIEPGEIEYHLLEYPGVSGAVVEGRPGPAGFTELVAWYVVAGSSADPIEMRRHLGRFLPGYMIPARLIEVSALPLLDNGKIDRKNLPDPGAARRSSPGTAPTSDLESTILGIWQSSLGPAVVGCDTNFFDAGGNSLLLVRLHSILEERFPGVVKLAELFSVSSVGEQARLIAERSAHPASGATAATEIRDRLQARTAFEPSQAESLRRWPILNLARSIDEQQGLARNAEEGADQRIVVLGGSGSRKLFCFAPGTGSCSCYYEMARRFSGWEVYGLDFVETARPAAVLAGILARAQPSGAFTLLGYSLGGNLAYEVSYELAALGRELSGLLLIDSWRRLEPFRFTEPQALKNAEDLLLAVDPNYLTLASRDAMIRRVQRYDRFMDSRVEDRLLSCPLHLIQAESSELQSPFRMTQEGWSELTADFHIVAGSGRHMEMLEEPHLSKNSSLIQLMLDSIALNSAEEPKLVRP